MHKAPKYLRNPKSEMQFSCSCFLIVDSLQRRLSVLLSQICLGNKKTSLKTPTTENRNTWMNGRKKLKALRCWDGYIYWCNDPVMYLFFLLPSSCPYLMLLFFYLYLSFINAEIMLFRTADSRLTCWRVTSLL